MISKIDIRPIIKAHLNTLRLPRTGRLLKRDVVGFYAAPCVLGGIMVALGLEFSVTYIGYALVAHTIYIPLLVSVLFSIFSISQSSRFSEAQQPTSEQARRAKKVRKLLNEVCDNVSYIIVISFVSALLLSATKLSMMFCLDVPFLGEQTNDAIDCVGDAGLLFVTYSLLIHIVLTTLMIVKRTHAILTLEFQDDG